MGRFSRFLVALAILLSAAALMPYVALPAEKIDWQLFADTYELPPTVNITPETAAPGSVFDVSCSNFPENSQATIRVNNFTFPTTVPTGPAGSFTFALTTTTVSTGTYFVTVSVNSASGVDVFSLDPAASLRSSTSLTTILSVPNGIGITPKRVYLPVIRK